MLYHGASALIKVTRTELRRHNVIGQINNSSFGKTIDHQIELVVVYALNSCSISPLE